MSASMPLTRFVWGDPLTIDLNGELFCAFRCRCCKQNAIEPAESHEVDAQECNDCYRSTLEGSA